MAYGQNISLAGYPNPAINPADKNYNWILQYVKAAYSDCKGYMPFGYLNTGSLKMTEIAMYCLGKQPVAKYKKMMSPGNPSDESWRAIDWTPPAFMCKFREIALSLLHQRKLDVSAYAVDDLSRTEEDEFFNQLRVKIMMRAAAMQMQSGLAEDPTIAAQPGEPQDLEQLAMFREHTYKHQMAAEAEDAINLVFQQNDIDEIEKTIEKHHYDFGLAAVAAELNEKGMVTIRNIDPEYLGLSYCEKPDFSDLVHWWELIPTYVADLAPFYTKEQLDKICQQALNKHGNPRSYTPTGGLFNPSWSRFKVMVMKIRFLSWNDTVYKEEVDSSDNQRFFRSKYENKKFLSVNKTGDIEESEQEVLYNSPISETGDQGQATPKFIDSTKKVVYQASWVVDTDFMHDYGLKKNQNRKLSSWWDTDLGIQIYAPHFYKMQFSGIAERLIPMEDKACMTWFNLQNLSNKLIPYLINIDLNTVEGTGLGKNGQNLKPSEVIEFIFSNFIAPFRSTDLTNRNPNYKPVSIEATGQLGAFKQLYEELQQTLEIMRQISGLNELTDGSTPNAKTLVPVAEAAMMSTNNALYLLAEGKKKIIRDLADAVVQQVQIAVSLGKVEGYAKALGTGTVQFFSINPELSMRELGIFIDYAPTQAEREALWTDLNIKESQGLLTVEDKYYIMTCRNLRKAAALISYKVEKKQEQAHQRQMELANQQTDGNMAVAQATKEMEMEQIAFEKEADLEALVTEKLWDYEIEKMKKAIDLEGSVYQTDGRSLAAEIAGKAKVISAEISAKASAAKKKAAAKKK